MDIKRGTPPPSVERDITVEMSREEVQTILSGYIKKKLNTDRLNLVNITVIGSGDGKLETVTLSGTETIPLTWQAPTDPVTPPVVPPAPVK